MEYKPKTNDMTIAALQSLFKRDLEKLKNEVELYTSEENLWRIEKEPIGFL